MRVEMRVSALDAGGPVPVVGVWRVLGQKQPVRQQSDRGSVARRHDAAVPRETAEQPIALKPSKIGDARQNEVDGDIVGRRSEERRVGTGGVSTCRTQGVAIN